MQEDNVNSLSDSCLFTSMSSLFLQQMCFYNNQVEKNGTTHPKEGKGSSGKGKECFYFPTKFNDFCITMIITKHVILKFPHLKFISTFYISFHFS